MALTKQVIIIVLAAALIADVAVFLGVGFGLGALSIAGTPGDNYQTNPYNNGQLTFGVHFINVEGGSTLLTPIAYGYQSIPLDFATTITYNGGGCGSNPSWDMNRLSGSIQPLAYSIAFSQPVTGLFDGASFTTGSGTTLSVNLAGTYPIGPSDPVLAFCVNLLGGPSFRAPAGLLWNHTIILEGTPGGGAISGTVGVSVSIGVTGQWCDGTLPGYATGACLSAFTDNQDYPGIIDNGAWNGVASASATFQSGSASAIVQNPGNLAYNGGTISVSVTTGHGGFTAALYCPQPRTPANGGCQGGARDPRFAQQSIPDGVSGYLVDWSVPAGTGQLSGTSGWNIWELVLNNTYLTEQYSPVVIDIAPSYSPGLPVITFTTNDSTYFYPQAGDAVTLTIYANSTSQSGPVTGITVWAYYLPVSANPIQEPPCGALWITTGCPYGTPLTGSQLVTNTGGGAVGTYVFTVGPPSGTGEIGILAEGFTSQQQGSPIVGFIIQITPHGCTAGTPGCPTLHAFSTWKTIGPILLSVALLLLGVLISFLVAVPWMRFLAIAAPAAVVVLGYLFFFGPAFLPGGIFNHGLV